jgi:hypothetical protein
VTAEPTETETTEEPQQPDDVTSTDPERLPDDHPVVKALRKANKEAEEYRLRVREFEEAQKSEEQKLTERLSELETTARTSTSEAARLRVALRKGLPETLVDRLRGDTPEEIEADADQLLELVAADQRPSVSRRPQEQLRPGASGTTDEPVDTSSLAERLLGEGRL